MEIGNRVVGLREVSHLTNLSKTTIYRMLERKEFPAPIEISVRRIGWYLNDILDWLAARPRK